MLLVGVSSLLRGFGWLDTLWTVVHELCCSHQINCAALLIVFRLYGRSTNQIWNCKPRSHCYSLLITAASLLLCQLLFCSFCFRSELLTLTRRVQTDPSSHCRSCLCAVAGGPRYPVNFRGTSRMRSGGETAAAAWRRCRPSGEQSRHILLIAFLLLAFLFPDH